jgi:hypothetical protein
MQYTVYIHFSHTGCLPEDAPEGGTMRSIWSGVLMAGLLLVLWGVFEARRSTPSDPTRYYWEDGTPPPTQPTPKPPSRT